MGSAIQVSERSAINVNWHLLTNTRALKHTREGDRDGFGAEGQWRYLAADSSHSNGESWDMFHNFRNRPVKHISPDTDKVLSSMLYACIMVSVHNNPETTVRRTNFRAPVSGTERS
jgi:hypothetical protein